MLFSSLVFIWFFLPVVFVLYHLVPWKSWKNLILLAASLFFYAWGEPKYILLMLVSIFINYVFGLGMGLTEKKTPRSLLLFFCLAVNLGLLGYFKYFNFLAETVNLLLGGERVSLRQISLPIGISFYTFQALSYVMDVYRRDIGVQKNPFYLALYISFFPQLIAGPIVKYHDIEAQIAVRETNLEKQAYGIKRFSYGLGKKVILANTFAQAADRILALPGEEMGTVLTWFGVLLYALQIYFDFSGYSDMAIGLGKMFGFDFMENFHYPYLSASVSEFWRRWHISLSTWFREYLYIPLGGNRKGLGRTCLNLFVVFLATGLWHGASITFVLWGVYYGIFLVAERLFLGNALKKNTWKWLNHVYTMLIVLFGWMLFRAEHMSVAKDWLVNMLTWKNGLYPVGMFADPRLLFWMAAGILLCGPLQCLVPGLEARLYREDKVDGWDVAAMAGIVFYSTMLLVSNTYNPFIYFRF
ncbi:MAG: MBOAT family O-acyltransferase [Lachnospiraceae bacterium]|nr:MBOAT family O-acyltransferase [Lachnospiraceae bacterium]